MKTTYNVQILFFTALGLFLVGISAKAQLVFEKNQYQVDETIHLIICNRMPGVVSDKVTSVQFDKLYTFSSPVASMQVGTPYEVYSDTTAYKLYFTRLPIVNLTIADSINADVAVGGLLTIADTTGAIYISDIGINTRGSYSSTFPKKSYKVQLWTDSTGASTKDESIFAMRSDQTWLLLAMYNERLRLNNRVSDDLWLKIHKLYYADQEPDAHAAIRTRYVEVSLNNHYQGVYLFTENMDRKELKIKKQTIAAVGGELYKGESWDLGTVFSGLPALPDGSPTEEWGGWELSYPDTTDWVNLHSFTDFVVTSSDSAFNQQIGTKLRQDNFADYFIFLNLLRAEDNAGKNLFLAKYNKDEPYFIAPWDLDGTWGYYWDGSQKNVTDDILSNNLFNRLLNSTTTFKSQLATRWFSLRKTTLSIDSLYNSITTNYNFLTTNGVYERENMKWSGDLLAYGNDELTYIHTWLQTRVNWLDSYFSTLSPVESIVYTFGASLSGSSVLTTWNANCSTIYSFDVERSTDSLTWSTINNSPLLTTDSPTCQFTFTDNDPQVGTSYYRLKITDNQNGISYSPSQLIIIESSTVSVFPNPASTILQVRGNVEKVNIYSSLGKFMYESDSPNTVDVKQLPTGMYLVRITEKNGAVSTHKILVNTQ